MIFSLSRHRRKHWLTRLHCGGDKPLLIISNANFLTVSDSFQIIRNILIPVTRKRLLPESALCKETPMLFKLLLQLGLHVVLPLTSYDLFSQILSVYERSIEVFLFFFFVCFFLGGEGCFVFTSESGNLLKYMTNWVTNCMQNLKGGRKFPFPKMFNSYRDLFLWSFQFLLCPFLHYKIWLPFWISKTGLLTFVSLKPVRDGGILVERQQYTR